MKMTAMPLRRHAADGIEQRRSLLFRQNGGRLVENKQLEMLLAQLTRDLGELLMADRHIADDHVGVDVDAHFFNGLLAALRSISL